MIYVKDIKILFNMFIKILIGFIFFILGFEINIIFISLMYVEINVFFFSFFFKSKGERSIV